MKGSKQFLLLDVDGVLLEAHGYRLAYLDTVNDFLVRMGQPDLAIDRQIPDAFEAGGIRAEWDMVPLTLAAFVNWYCSISGETFDADPFPPDCSRIHITDRDAFRKMLLDHIREYCSFLNSECPTMEAIYRAYAGGRGKLLDRIWRTPLFDRFFIDTKDPWKCPFFAQLMNRLLGAELFESFYGMKAPVECVSYLATMDRLLISDHYRKLLPEISGKTVYPVVMTYRPTRMPHPDGNKSGTYFVNTPEGECALQLLGWQDRSIPMIGYGSLCYIEDKYGVPRESYVKPHPLHGLASMMMALCRDEILSLEISRQLCELDPKKDPNPAAAWLDPAEKISLAVFEDSVTGIGCARNAARVLRDWGYDAYAVLCGIRTTEAKNNRLLYEGAVLYKDVNAALDAVLPGDD